MGIKEILGWIKDGMIIVSLIGVIYGAYTYVKDKGAKDREYEGRMHSTVEDRVIAEEHLKHFKEDLKVRTDFQIHVDQVLHDITQMGKRIEEQRKQDSILRMKDAVTNYQAKVNSDTLIKYWKEYNESVKNEGSN